MLSSTPTDVSPTVTTSNGDMLFTVGSNNTVFLQKGTQLASLTELVEQVSSLNEDVANLVLQSGNAEAGASLISTIQGSIDLEANRAKAREDALTAAIADLTNSASSTAAFTDARFGSNTAMVSAIQSSLTREASRALAAENSLSANTVSLSTSQSAVVASLSANTASQNAQLSASIVTASQLNSQSVASLSTSLKSLQASYDALALAFQNLQASVGTISNCIT
jgi:hypothetical protein